ncbi:FTR1 family protein [Thioclava sp. A2]|uniref:FTR1 family iron permease n=1 Tax=Thioclava sp. FCG-A2 TaxID=3080562 RepID=UPI00295311AC|nr:FTR1 family protein [Thioclava sp. A2]MDV7270802.1 FTR1 family protein [Thioclava sp. A2]
MTSLLRFVIALCLALLAAPLHAETPWAAGEVLRSEAGRVERLLYRPDTAERSRALARHLQTMQAALAGADPAFGPHVAQELAAFQAQAEAGAAPGVARARQRLWGALTLAAREQTLAAIARADAEAAANWLTLRDYARASGDTAAALAVQALGQGTMTPKAVRQVVEGELLTVAASELRLALRRAADDAAAGHRVQYTGGLGRIEGLLAYLGENLQGALGAEGMAALRADLARAETDPAALTQIKARLAGYAPVALSADERLRRARLLRRFTALVWEEYRDGVRDGEISQPMEYNEARLFADRAVMILSDLAPQMDDDGAAARLAGLLAQARDRMAQKADGVEPLIAEALAEIDRSFGAEVAAGGYEAALDALPAALDELALMVQSGDWSGAELKRLEAYSWFDPDIEQRLVPRAPAMALRLEARFWEGTAARPGLGMLIARQADPALLRAEIDGIKSDLAAVKARIEVQPTPFGSALQSAGIIFREGLEAVLILAALLAALRAEGLAPARFRPALSFGVGLAVAGSFALWGATRWLFSLSTLAREALEGGTALLAAVVLIWLVLGIGGSGGHVAAFRARLARVASPLSVGVLAFLVVFREGFETVLFYEALLVDAAHAPVLAGLAFGAGAALFAGWVVFASGRKLPLRLFFRATTALLAGLAVMLVGAGVRGLQTAALIGATPVAWFPDTDWLQLWFGLFPVAEPLAAQAAVLVILLTPWRGMCQSVATRRDLCPPEN